MTSTVCKGTWQGRLYAMPSSQYHKHYCCTYSNEY